MKPRRRGRPPDRDSDDTRRAIIDAARRVFATDGFHGGSLTAIASEAHLTTSALYHYFDDKTDVYESVMVETVDLVWQALLDSVNAATDLAGQVDAFLGQADDVASDDRMFSAFLVAVPVEARRNPEFVPLLELRTKWEDKVFMTMAQTGVATGEVVGFDSVDDVSQAIRMILTGWSFETHYQPQYRQIRAEVVRKLFAALSQHD